MKHLIYDDDVRDVTIDIYTDELYDDDGDIFSQGVTMYENYRDCSIRVTINRKRDRKFIFKLYISKNEDSSFKIIYTDMFREVGSTELHYCHVGSTSSPLCETTSSRMYNNTLNSIISDAARPKSHQESTLFLESKESRRMRSSRLFF